MHKVIAHWKSPHLPLGGCPLASEGGIYGLLLHLYSVEWRTTDAR